MFVQLNSISMLALVFQKLDGVLGIAVFFYIVIQALKPWTDEKSFTNFRFALAFTLYLTKFQSI